MSIIVHPTAEMWTEAGTEDVPWDLVGAKGTNAHAPNSSSPPRRQSTSLLLQTAICTQTGGCTCRTSHRRHAQRMPEKGNRHPFLVSCWERCRVRRNTSVERIFHQP